MPESDRERTSRAGDVEAARSERAAGLEGDRAERAEGVEDKRIADASDVEGQRIAHAEDLEDVRVERARGIEHARVEHASDVAILARRKSRWAMLVAMVAAAVALMAMGYVLILSFEVSRNVTKTDQNVRRIECLSSTSRTAPERCPQEK